MPKYHLASLEPEIRRFCRETWDVHEARGGAVRPGYSWPRRSTFRANWPDMALDLIVADWQIREAQSGAAAIWKESAPESDGDRRVAVRLGKEVEISYDEPGYPTLVAEIDEELLNPPPSEPHDWHRAYARELVENVSIAYLIEPDAKGYSGVARTINWIIDKKLRHLPAPERMAIRLYLGGATFTGIAKQLTQRYRRTFKPDQIRRLLDVDERGQVRQLRDALAQERRRAS